MSGKDHNRKRNISVTFRLSEAEKRALEARLEVCGIKRTHYYIQSVLYSRLLVTGSRENIDRLIMALNELELTLQLLLEEIHNYDNNISNQEMLRMKNEYVEMVKAIYEIAKAGNESIN